MESKCTQPMEKTIVACCQRLLNDIVSLTILDLLAGYIFFIIMRWIENRFLFLRALLLQFLLSFILDKLCPKYINFILSYVYISTCKTILLRNFPKISIFLVIRSRGKIVFGVSASAFFIPASFFLKSYVFNNLYLKYLAFGLFVPHSNIKPCPIETPQDEIDIKEIKLSTDDLKIIVHKLCQCTKEEGDEIDDCIFGYEEFSTLFETFEPDFDEVYEAFSIFDQDRDGFFDARDLQIVLINLGLGGNANLNECQHMIEQHDRGGDGKISSSDFCRILEVSFL